MSLATSSSPLLSFVMPAYKQEWLDKAVESILSQTYPNIELIVVNDCSPNDLDSVMARFDDPRIRYYHNAENIGGKHLTRQWDHCIQFARGEYLVIAADDDIYAPTFAEECMRLAVAHPEVDLIRTRVEEVDEEGDLVGLETFPAPKDEVMSQLEYIYAYRSGMAFICMGNFVFKTSALRTKGFVDFPRALGSDIATSIELAAHGVACSSEVLFAFRHSSIHLSGSVTQLAPKIEATSLFYEWMMNYPLPEAQGKYDRYYLKQLTRQDWQEKCVYDYYNMVLRHIPLTQLPSYLKLARLASTKEKVTMVLRRLKDAVS